MNGDAMKTTPTQPAISYTRSSACAATGLPGATIDLAINTGELKAIKSGRRLVILAEDLQAWLRRCRERGEIPVPRPSGESLERLAALNRARKAAA
jgi:excisionase family DNA binding protein